MRSHLADRDKYLKAAAICWSFDHSVESSLSLFIVLWLSSLWLLRSSPKVDELCSSRISLLLNKSRSRSPLYHNCSVLDTNIQSSLAYVVYLISIFSMSNKSSLAVQDVFRLRFLLWTSDSTSLLLRGSSQRRVFHRSSSWPQPFEFSSFHLLARVLTRYLQHPTAHSNQISHQTTWSSLASQDPSSGSGNLFSSQENEEDTNLQSRKAFQTFSHQKLYNA